MSGHLPLPALLLASAALLVAVGAVAVVVVRRRRAADGTSTKAARDAHPTGRQLDEQDVGPDVFDLATEGVMALAATIPGVRLAAQVARAGAEVGRLGLAPAVAVSLRRIADYAESDGHSLYRVIGDDGTLVLMFSDIEGSTALNEQLGDAAWLELLKRHNAVVRCQVRRHHGQVVKTHGDSFMVVFRTLADALHCAVAIHQGLGDAEMRDDARIRVRIGIHQGAVTRQGRDVFGLNVALAARVASEAGGGETLVSADVAAAAAGLDGLDFGEGRTVRLKGLSQPVTVYPVAA